MGDSDINFDELISALAELNKEQVGGSKVDIFTKLYQEFKPEIDKGIALIEEVLVEYLPKIEEASEAIRSKSVEADIKSMREYKDAGINEQIAYQLVRDRYDRIQQSVNQLSKK